MARFRDRNQAVADTVAWCQAVKTASKKNNSEILDACFGKDHPVSEQTFSRWMSGKHAMPPDKLQMFVRNASKKGWIAKPGQLLTGASTRAGIEPGRRLNTQGEPILNSVLIRKHIRAVERLHETQQKAVAALSELEKAMKDASDVLCFDADQIKRDGDEPEIDFTDIRKIANQVNRIGFFDVSPWAKGR